MEFNALTALLFMLMGLTALNFILTLLLLQKTRRMSKKDIALVQEAKEKGLEPLLRSNLEKMEQVQKQYEEVKFFEKKLLEMLPPCLQKVGLVRFNAFSDIGGDQSFALALLDAKDKGIIISSLYGRNDARVYAKPVDGGKSSYPLSEEEQKALTLAVNKLQEHTA